MAKKIDIDGMESILIDTRLETLQEAVGGYIKPLRFPGGGGYMIVNEEGLLMKLPVNETATAIASCCWPRLDMPIVGNVVICDEDEFD
jgi:hypothetical protein